MTFNEVAVVVVGAFAGYWIIDAVLNRSPSSKNGNSPASDRRDAMVDGKPDVDTVAGSDADYEEYIASHWWSILGVTKEAGKGDIAAAYQHLLAECAPDKVAHLGEEFRELAASKVKKLQDAYEYGMSQAL